MWQAIAGALIGGASGALQAQGQEGGKPRLKEARTKQQIRGQKFLEKLMYQGYVPQPTAPVAGLSDEERQAAEMIQQYAASRPEGADYLRSIIESDRDITEDPAYAALFKQVREAGGRETNRLGRSLQLRGGATSSTGRDILGRSVADMEANLLATGLPYAEQEKSRKMAAANALAALSENATLSRLNALSTQGALERNLEQLRQEADYERKLKEVNWAYDVQAPIATTLGGMQGSYVAYARPNIPARWAAGLQGAMGGASSAMGGSAMSSI